MDDQTQDAKPDIENAADTPTRDGIMGETNETPTVDTAPPEVADESERLVPRAVEPEDPFGLASLSDREVLRKLADGEIPRDAARTYLGD